jgi:hypothetical protein
MNDTSAALERAYTHALGWIDSLPTRTVNATRTADQLLSTLDVPLPDQPTDPAHVVDALAAAAEPGLVATPSGRFFGSVVGGTLPAPLAADWLTATWDQNAAFAMLAPAAAAAEAVTAGWLVDVLGLPAIASVGFVTGCAAADFTCLAAARHRVLAAAGWDVEADGLQGAPKITIVASEDPARLGGCCTALSRARQGSDRKCVDRRAGPRPNGRARRRASGESRAR